MGNERKQRPFILRWRAAVLNSSEPASTKLTLLALAEHAGPSGSECYPGIDTLAKQTSQGEKTCRRSLDSADGRWFAREPVKFAGRDWRGYSYQLLIPEGAVTVTAPRREVAVTVTGPQSLSCGHSSRELRSLTPRAAVTVTDDLGKAPRKSTKGESTRTKNVVPSWLPADSWQAWKEHRGSKFSARSQGMAIRKLEALRGEGHDPAKLIDLAIESGWSSFYPRDQTLAAQRAPGVIERDQRSDEEIDRANREQLARFGLGEAA